MTQEFLELKKREEQITFRILIVIKNYPKVTVDGIMYVLPNLHEHKINKVLKSLIKSKKIKQIVIKNGWVLNEKGYILSRRLSRLMEGK